MFIELTRVYYDSDYCRYVTGKLFIRATGIVSVTDADTRFGGYECRCIQSDNGKVHYVTDSYKSIVDKMSAIANLMYNKEEDNDWK